MDNWLQKVVELFSSAMVSAFFAGLAGGIVAIWFEEDKITIRKSIGIIVMGVLGAIYLGGIILAFFKGLESSQNGVRFICGLCAVQLFEAIILMAGMVKRDPLGFIKKIRNGNRTKS